MNNMMPDTNLETSMFSRRDALLTMGSTTFILGLSGCCSLPRAAAASPIIDDGLDRAEPDELGVDPDAVLAYLAAMDAADLDLHSVMIYRHGAVAAEGWWWPYRSELPHMTHSATKSFTSAGVGLAVSEGLIQLSDRVLDFFPGRVSAPSDNLKAMTVESLLTQTAGHAYGISGSSWRILETSWVDEFLKVPVDFKPGTHFAYSSATSYMLSAIVTQATGQTLHAYMKPRLFDPLGMHSIEWDVSPEGVNPGGNGLSASTPDFLKLGILHLQQGKWNQQQILPEDWIEAVATPKFGNPYSYHWWVAPEQLGYFAAGKFGQFCFVFPGLDAVMVVTSGVADNKVTRDRMHAIAFEFVPQIFSGGGASKAASVRMDQQLEQLRLLPPMTPTQSPLAKTLNERPYIAEPNVDGIKGLRLDFDDDVCKFNLVDERGVHTIINGLRTWREDETTMTGGYLHHEYEPESLRVVAGAKWVSENKLVMTWQYNETAWQDTVTITVEEDKLYLDRRVNVNSSALSRPTVTFVAT